MVNGYEFPPVTMTVISKRQPAEDCPTLILQNKKSSSVDPSCRWTESLQLHFL